MMIAAALILIAMPVERPLIVSLPPVAELTASEKKRRRTIGGAGAARKFSSCAAARKAGFTHMRRGQAGYSKTLDRDGDGVACDKVG